MRSTSRAVLAGATLVLLAGCSLWKNEKPAVEYNTPGTKKTTSSLSVPPDLITPARDDRFTVPDGAPRGTATYSSYAADRQPSASAPGATNIQPGTANMQIQHIGNDRWLVVKGIDPAVVWQKVADFWRETGFVLVTENQAAGLMETEWAENHAKVTGDPIQEMLRKALGTHYSTGERDKFRIRLETTATPGAVEIYVSHRGMIEVTNNSTTGSHWEQRAGEPDLEAEMLQRLMVRLGSEPKVAEKAVADSKVAAPARAKLETGADGSRQLVVNDPLDRAWRQVGLALDRTGVVVEDRDRSKGLYFVRYIVTEDPNEAKGSWFSRLWSKKASGTNQFRVEVSGTGDTTVVRLSTKDGAKAPDSSVKQILTLLLNELK